MMFITLIILSIIFGLSEEALSGIEYCNHDLSEAPKSGANDVVVVQQEDGSFQSTPFHVQVGKFTNIYTIFNSRERKKVEIYVNGHKGITDLYTTDSGFACFNRNSSFEKTWTPEEWNKVPLTPGKNYGYFNIEALSVRIPFTVYMYNRNFKAVISDIDGTITVSDIIGRVVDLFGGSAHQEYVIQLYKAIYSRGYKIIYLTARSLDEASFTRKYLFNTLKELGLPEGPLLMAPKPFSDAVLDLISSFEHITKYSTLKNLFNKFSNDTSCIVGAYGNRLHDAEAYKSVNIDPHKIFIVNPNGMIRYADGQTTNSSYELQLRNIDQLYPTINN